MTFRYVFRPDHKQIIERENTMVLVNGELVPVSEKRLGADNYREEISNTINIAVKQAIEIEVRQAVQDLVEENRKVIRQSLEDHKAILRELVWEARCQLAKNPVK
jgi:uncharacterized FAD-dependent dehydrogenase